MVDDDVDLLEQAGVVLQSAGYEIVTAVGQEEAEEKMLSVHPDLCVVDLMMEHQDCRVRPLQRHQEALSRNAGDSPDRRQGDHGARLHPRATEDAVSWLKADALLDKPIAARELQGRGPRGCSRGAGVRRAAPHLGGGRPRLRRDDLAR